MAEQRVTINGVAIVAGGDGQNRLTARLGRAMRDAYAAGEISNYWTISAVPNDSELELHEPAAGHPTVDP